MHYVLDREVVEWAIERVNDMGYDLELKESYSGRGMYGKTCFGIVGKQTAAQLFFHKLHSTEIGGNMIEELILRTSTDSMGYDTIFYFPGVECVYEPLAVAAGE